MSEHGNAIPQAGERGDEPLRTEITPLLLAWGEGDERALERLSSVVYDELRRLARGRMRRERGQHTLQTTALVHEAFLRLVDQKKGWESRGHFFALAATMMRRVLVDYARRAQGKKRGGEAVRLALDEAPELAARSVGDVLRVHEALDDLAKVDARKAKMVELRFFAGLSIDETAACLGVSPGTVMRDWTLAKAWLKRYIQPPTSPLLA
ncbi:MAG: ECF-type sigma factor [Acidobacteriota bacterium]